MKTHRLLGERVVCQRVNEGSPEKCLVRWDQRREELVWRRCLPERETQAGRLRKEGVGLFLKDRKQALLLVKVSRGETVEGKAVSWASHYAVP